MESNTTVIRRIAKLASYINKDIFVGLLIIRHASVNYVPTFTQLEIKDFLNEPKHEEIPEKTPWHIVANALSGKYVYAIICALRSIMPRFPLLHDLEETIQSTKPDETILHEMIELLSSISLDDISLSQVYEYRLSKETLANPLVSGDFKTPYYIIQLILNLLDIKGDCEIYDPCCGSGAMLYHANLLMSKTSKFRLYGQTVDRASYQICQTNLFLRDIFVDLGGKPSNTLIEDLHAGQTFDYILSNPPFNLANWCDGIYPEYDIRWQYGPAPRSNANYAWIQHIISHQSEKGRAVVILPNGTLTTQTRAERNIRHSIIYDGLIEAIITLPSKLFYSTKVPCCIWILGKTRKPGASTLLVDARQFKLTDEKACESEEARKLIEVVLQHRNGILHGKTDWYAVVSLEDIAQKGFILSPNFYTQDSAIPLKPLRRNWLRFIELIDTLSSRLGDSFLSPLIHQWTYMQASTHWKKAFLTELYQVSGGLAKKKDSFGHGTEIVDVKTVINHVFLPDTLSTYVDVTKEEAQKYHIRVGDILLNRTSETIEELACCCVAATDQNAIYGSYVKRLRLIEKEHLNPFYMAAYFRSAIYRYEVKKVSPIYTTRASINMERLAKIFIYYPDADMQNKLGDTLFAISRFQKECYEKTLVDSLNQFVQLLIEQFITYPVLCLQKEEVDIR